MKRKDKIHTLFWLQFLGLNGCWEWRGARDNTGYGKFMADGKRYYAHRYSYMHNVGKIKRGMYVLHKCDNPPCIRPSHLYIGTKKQNTQDAVRRGRIAHGSRCPQSKFTKDDVDMIRAIYKGGKTTQQEIADEYGVSRPTITNIINNKNWKSYAR